MESNYRGLPSSWLKPPFVQSHVAHVQSHEGDAYSVIIYDNLSLRLFLHVLVVVVVLVLVLVLVLVVVGVVVVVVVVVYLILLVVFDRIVAVVVSL